MNLGTIGVASCCGVEVISLTSALHNPCGLPLSGCGAPFSSDTDLGVRMEAQNQADATAKPSSTEVTEEGTTLEPSKERIPIVWKGKAKEDASSSKPAEAAKAPDTQPAPEPKLLQRMKPNAAFLLNVVADAQRGNERLCAEEATSASLTVLGQVM